MAAAFSAFVYGVASTYDAKNGGWAVKNVFTGSPSQRSFPVAGTEVIQTTPVTVGTATCNSIIAVYPTGLNTHEKLYFTDSSFSTLSTNRG